MPSRNICRRRMDDCSWSRRKLFVNYQRSCTSRAPMHPSNDGCQQALVPQQLHRTYSDPVRSGFDSLSLFLGYPSPLISIVLSEPDTGLADDRDSDYPAILLVITYVNLARIFQKFVSFFWEGLEQRPQPLHLPEILRPEVNADVRPMGGQRRKKFE